MAVRWVLLALLAPRLGAVNGADEVALAAPTAPDCGVDGAPPCPSVRVQAEQAASLAFKTIQREGGTLTEAKRGATLAFEHLMSQGGSVRGAARAAKGVICSHQPWQPSKLCSRGGASQPANAGMRDSEAAEQQLTAQLSRKQEAQLQNTIAQAESQPLPPAAQHRSDADA